MNRINYNKLKAEAELINWSELPLINEPNLALNNLVSEIKICLSKAKLHAMNRINYNKLKAEAELINWWELPLINEPNLALNNLVSEIKICLSKAEYSKKDYKKNIFIQEKIG